MDLLMCHIHILLMEIYTQNDKIDDFCHMKKGKLVIQPGNGLSLGLVGFKKPLTDQESLLPRPIVSFTCQTKNTAWQCPDSSRRCFIGAPMDPRNCKRFILRQIIWTTQVVVLVSNASHGFSTVPQHLLPICSYTFQLFQYFRIISPDSSTTTTFSHFPYFP